MAAFWRRLLSFCLCFYSFARVTAQDALACSVPEETEDFCQCDIQGLAAGPATFDLRPLFASGALQTQSEGFLFTLSPCTPFLCSNHTTNVAVCQENLSDRNLTFALGTVSSVEYDLSGSDPGSNQWLVLATYFMGDSTEGIVRTAQVRYMFNSSVTSPQFSLTVDDPSQLNYFFAVESDMVLPLYASPPPARLVPAVGWVFIALGALVVSAFAIIGAAVCVVVQVRRRSYHRLPSSSQDEGISPAPVMLSGGEKTLQWSLLEEDGSSKSVSNDVD